jgi:hypothetical protein
LERLQWTLAHPVETSVMRQNAREHALARISKSVVSAQLLECFASAGVANMEAGAPLFRTAV